MRIANPLYDTIFKYLMEDMESATLLISTILGTEILNLSPAPQEHTFRVRDNSHATHTVFRLDYAATIRTNTGGRRVLIEIQKAKLASDIMRFRRYLGKNYADPANTHIDGEGKPRPLPIVTIYFLGYLLEHIVSPVVDVYPVVSDAATGEILHATESFIESLTHESHIIQVERLKEPYRSETEQMLSVFDQTHSLENGHFLRVDDDKYPAKYRSLMRRLMMAAEDEEIVDQMQMEDDYLRELQQNERKAEESERKALEAMEAREQSEREKLQAMEAREQSEREKLEAMEAREQSEREKLQAIEEVAKKNEELKRKDADLENSRQEAERNLQEAERKEAQMREMQALIERLTKPPAS